ncbi:hypothetical protein C2S51_036080 [Perilla frutescens var. frutescens]|nr:hypothetical protein C2S51_036080 [Perilla frutescens var. frutescens]
MCIEEDLDRILFYGLTLKGENKDPQSSGSSALHSGGHEYSRRSRNISVALVWFEPSGVKAKFDRVFYSNEIRPDYQSFRIGSDGNLQGVGLFINAEPKTGHLVVLSCIENSPAARAGIHEGDELIEINGERLEGVDSEAAAQKLRGRVGTTVTVKVHSVDELESPSIRQVRIPHEVIKFSPVSSAIILHRAPDGHVSKTGYTAAMEMENTVHEMENQGVQSYILDLRNNPVKREKVVKFLVKVKW